MSDILLSIIVPIYNAEVYLERLIKSVLSQKIKNYELILINDGSKDNSLTIMNKYSTYKNIKIIDKPNSGVSSTRNFGINIARGKYITFIDSDDYYRDNTINNVLNKINSNADLIVFSAKYLDEMNNEKDIFLQDDSFKNVHKNFGIDGYIFFDFDFEYGNCIWNKIYKLDIIKNNNIYFYENQSMAEDLIFNIDYFQNISNVQTISDCVYNYCYNKNSITKSYNKKCIDDHMKAANNLKKILDKYNYSNKSDVIVKYFINTFIFVVYNEVKSNSIKESFKKLKYYFESNLLVKNMKFFNFNRIKRKDRIKYLIIKLKLYNLFYCFIKVRSCLRDEK